ncbi:AIPR family protein [Billgrantia lactosivorans]|uniref:AIPR family protein n=1 Tax=Billgrantia lactosivorans TaxID=2185141 RepID=UPI000DABC70B|nr:AIPR family protein [Halomonas lactosivorans]
MKVNYLNYNSFSQRELKPYEKRAPDFSGRFVRWFLENIYRLEEIDADDACVDDKHDKGVDAIYVDDVSETVYIIQAKTKTKDDAEFGDTDIKEFYGTLQQFDSKEKIDEVYNETKNDRLKKTIARTRLSSKVNSGYDVLGVFISNARANDDAKAILAKLAKIELFDADAIANEYVDLDVDGGIKGRYYFDVSDSHVIEYDAGGAAARLFLAPALNLLKMNGIADGTLFEQNVRLALGNTKVNKGLRQSIREKSEHKNFPLYHNGINVLCKEIVSESEERIEVEDYVVVNGAQSLSSLASERSKITDDLKILVKLIETKDDLVLSQRITKNSNNQNAIKARDLKSNHNIQRRLKAEVSVISNDTIAYEIKQGEANKGKTVLKNESAGLILLAMDLAQPWSCHQKYKVMDDLHSNIFGRPEVTGARIVGYWECFKSVESALDAIEDKHFAYYNLTKYFLAYAVVSLIRTESKGVAMLNNMEGVIRSGRQTELFDLFGSLAKSLAFDLNAEIVDEDAESFDYKNELKSPTWCKKTSARLVAQYSKDVMRKKADPISALCSDLARAI